MTGAYPSALPKGSGGAFFITVLWAISWFIKIELKKFTAAIRATKKFRMVFNHFCYNF